MKFVDGGGHGVNVQQMAVFSDGTLLATRADFPMSVAQEKTWRGSRFIGTASSEDGGVASRSRVKDRRACVSRATTPTCGCPRIPARRGPEPGSS